MKLTEIITKVRDLLLNLVQGVEEWKVANITATSEKSLRNHQLVHLISLQV